MKNITYMKKHEIHEKTLDSPKTHYINHTIIISMKKISSNFSFYPQKGNWINNDLNIN